MTMFLISWEGDLHHTSRTSIYWWSAGPSAAGWPLKRGHQRLWSLVAPKWGMSLRDWWRWDTHHLKVQKRRLSVSFLWPSVSGGGQGWIFFYWSDWSQYWPGFTSSGNLMNCSRLQFNCLIFFLMQNLVDGYTCYMCVYMSDQLHR